MDYLDDMVWNFWMNSGCDGYDLADRLEKLALEVREAEDAVTEEIAEELGL